MEVEGNMVVLYEYNFSPSLTHVMHAHTQTHNQVELVSKRLSTKEREVKGRSGTFATVSGLVFTQSTLPISPQVWVYFGSK